MKDDQTVLRAGLLFNSLMNDYEEYQAACSDDASTKELRSEMLVSRMQAMRPAELHITLLFTMDILHKVGPDTVTAALEKWITEHPEEETAEPSPAAPGENA